MTIQLSVVVQNARLDAIQTAVGPGPILTLFTGPQPVSCGAVETGAAIISYTLASSWASPATNGTKSFTNTPITGSSTQTGTLGHYRLFASDGVTCHMQGSISAVGGGGDMTVNNVNVIAPQVVQVTSWTLTDGNP